MSAKSQSTIFKDIRNFPFVLFLIVVVALIIATYILTKTAFWLWCQPYHPVTIGRHDIHTVEFGNGKADVMALGQSAATAFHSAVGETASSSQQIRMYGYEGPQGRTPVDENGVAMTASPPAIFRPANGNVMESGQHWIEEANVKTFRPTPISAKPVTG